MMRAGCASHRRPDRDGFRARLCGHGPVPLIESHPLMASQVVTLLNKRLMGVDEAVVGRQSFAVTTQRPFDPHPSFNPPTWPVCRDDRGVSRSISQHGFGHWLGRRN